MSSQSIQSSSNGPSSSGVACRPTLLFVAAYMLTITPHEAAHAITSYVLGFSSTLFQMWVNPDPTNATSRQLADIAAAGPIFSLAVGVTCRLFYQRRFRRRPSALLFLMLATVGIYSFLGPLTGSALGGDFSLAFNFLDASKAVRYLASTTGFVLLTCFMFFTGRKLVGWAPSSFGRVKAVGCTTVAPWLVGTALILLVYWPLPTFLIGSTVGGSVAVCRHRGDRRVLDYEASRAHLFIHQLGFIDYAGRDGDGALARAWSPTGSLVHPLLLTFAQFVKAPGSRLRMAVEKESNSLRPKRRCQ